MSTAIAMNRYLHQEHRSNTRSNVERKLKFWTTEAATVAAVVTDSAGTVLTQPVGCSKTGMIDVYSDSSPLYFTTNDDRYNVRKLELPQNAAGGSVFIYGHSPVADITAGTAWVAPAHATKQLVVDAIWMKAIGGNLSGPTTVEVIIETTGTVMLSHVTGDLTTAAGWRGGGTGDGTNVKTGITAGGLCTVAKRLSLTDTGGTAAATATHIDTIVKGYWI